MAPRSTADSKSGGAAYELRLLEAARLAKARLAREVDPEGRWEGGVWMPSKAERQICCEGVMPPKPIAGRQQTLENHCRTLTHVAHLKRVSPRDLQRKWREMGFKSRPSRSDQEEESPPAKAPSRTELFSLMRNLQKMLGTALNQEDSLPEEKLGDSADVPLHEGLSEEYFASLQEGTRYLNSDLHIKVGGRDKARWVAEARRYGLDVSQWIRRVLNRSSSSPLPPAIPEDHPLDEPLRLRVNRKDKERWRGAARAQGLGFAQWVRRALNAAVQAKREHPSG